MIFITDIYILLFIGWHSLTTEHKQINYDFGNDKFLEQILRILQSNSNCLINFIEIIILDTARCMQTSI